MAHRNRLFTVLKNGGSFHGYVKQPDGIYIYVYTYTHITQQVSPFINPTVDGCDILHQKDG